MNEEAGQNQMSCLFSFFSERIVFRNQNCFSWGRGGRFLFKRQKKIDFPETLPHVHERVRRINWTNMGHIFIFFDDGGA